MTTLSDLIERVRVAAGDTQHAIDQLNGALTNSPTATVTVDDGTKLPENSRIAIELETMLVTDKSSVTNATVLRGYEGTSIVAHADDLKVYISPRYTPHEYGKAINRALEAISFGFGKNVWDESQVFTTTKRIITTPAAAKRVWGVFEKPTANTDLTEIPFRFLPSAPTSLAANGKAIHLTSYNPGTGTCYIAYEQSWPVFDLDNVADALDNAYPSDAEDVIESGAISYLTNRDLFERLAFDAAHARLSPNLSTTDEARLAANYQLQNFLRRRFEVAARDRIDNFTWMP